MRTPEMTWPLVAVMGPTELNEVTRGPADPADPRDESAPSLGPCPELGGALVLPAVPLAGAVATEVVPAVRAPTAPDPPDSSKSHALAISAAMIAAKTRTGCKGDSVLIFVHHL